MQLRQFAPDVVRDVVIRFVERILNEILYAHTNKKLPRQELMISLLTKRTNISVYSTIDLPFAFYEASDPLRKSEIFIATASEPPAVAGG